MNARAVLSMLCNTGLHVRRHKKFLCLFSVFTMASLFIINLEKLAYHSRKSSGKAETIQDNIQTSPRYLCTWFTTFKELDGRQQIHLNTLSNWAKFIPLSQPVLFSSNLTRRYDSIARNLGWHVYEIPRTNDYGTPYISDMVEVIMNGTYDSIFYGFANGDILFDNSLYHTLMSVVAYKHNQTNATVLVTGRRTNYKLSSKLTQPISEFYDVEQLGIRGKLFSANAEDYFLFTSNFPRHLFKNLVLGRPGYDNYLVAMGVKLNVSVIDATNTITALHQQSPKESEKAGHHNKDVKHNYAAIGRFNYKKGNTFDAQLQTYFDPERIKIIIRSHEHLASMQNFTTTKVKH